MILLEEFLLINGVMDGFLLFGMARLLGLRRVSRLRLACAALFGALYAVCAYNPSLVFLQTPWAQPLCAGAMCGLCLGRVPLRTWAKGTGFLLLGAWVTGGIATALYRPGRALPALLLPAVLLALAAGIALMRRRHAPVREQAALLVHYRGYRIPLEGFVDTGNAALDPVNGLPIILAPAEKLGVILPLDADITQSLPEGLRMVSIRTATGVTLLPVFRPDALEIACETKQAMADAMVAIAPKGMLPMALVPPAAFANAPRDATERRPA